MYLGFFTTLTQGCWASKIAVQGNQCVCKQWTLFHKFYSITFYHILLDTGRFQSVTPCYIFRDFQACFDTHTMRSDYFHGVQVSLCGLVISKKNTTLHWRWSGKCYPNIVSDHITINEANKYYMPSNVMQCAALKRGIAPLTWRSQFLSRGLLASYFRGLKE